MLRKLMRILHLEPYQFHLVADGKTIHKDEVTEDIINLYKDYVVVSTVRDCEDEYIITVKAP